jgi:hypothetical protein
MKGLASAGPFFLSVPGSQRERSEVQRLIATGITGGRVGTYLYGGDLVGPARLREMGLPGNPEVQMMEEQKHADLGRGDRWLTASIVFACSAAVSAAATGYLWSRAQPSPRRLLIHPTSDGGAGSFAGSF